MIVGKDDIMRDRMKKEGGRDMGRREGRGKKNTDKNRKK